MKSFLLCKVHGTAAAKSKSKDNYLREGTTEPTMGDNSAPDYAPNAAQLELPEEKQDEGREHERKRWIWFITGPTACGKTTVAKALAKDLNFTFVEGDDYHPRANVEKMSRGEPLTDDDRAGWLEALRDHETAQPPAGESPHLVMTCSALKRHYRDVLREGGERAGNLRIRFVFLDGHEEVLTRRAAERKGHFAGANLVCSQFAALERPADDETDVLTVDVDRPIEDTEREATNRIKEEMTHDDGSYLKLL
ncbi:P-loop containing nucleoside triphosphate hydrolase protein [Apodospora peruviana]|uniref:Gluconokinase n=1 Tax=Apodospora peruviana TaxID=516989 RepID=A0AAE0HTB3_9PEZI|nr:P-loop containing nucleoside triphosphate hydrolase protein [Apodospora peruviana]